VYLVPQETNGVPIFNEVKLNSTNLYATYGLSDQLDVVMSLPYISAEGNASQEQLNNLNYSNTRRSSRCIFYLKYNPYFHNFGKSSLRLIGALGLKTPLGDYKVDEGLQSIAIGNRSTTVSALGLAMFKMDSGIFASGQIEEI
jgi:hypothetical protein